MKVITFVISKTGQVDLTTEGYAGDACKRASEPYERVLGLKTRDDDTLEAYLAQPDTHTEAAS